MLIILVNCIHSFIFLYNILKCNYKENKGDCFLLIKFIGMVAGLMIALINIFDPGFHGFMRWIMVICGFLIFISHLKTTLDKKKNTVVNRNK